MREPLVDEFDLSAGTEAVGRTRTRVAAILLLLALGAVAAFAIDLATLPHCDAPLIDPGFFVVPAMGLAVAAAVSAGMARSEIRNRCGDTSRASTLLTLGVLLFVGTFIGGAAAWIVTGVDDMMCGGFPSFPAL